MMSRAGLLAVVTAIGVVPGVVSMFARPAYAAPGEDAEEPGARTQPEAVPPVVAPVAPVAPVVAYTEQGPPRG